MYEIAEQVRVWLAAGRDVSVAQVVATRGFSSRDPGAAAAWSGSESVGQVLEGLDTRSLVGRPVGLHEIAISDDDAHRAGLSCGGTAGVLVQSASALGADVWDRLAAREPVLLVTSVATGAVSSYPAQTVREAPGEAPRIFGRGVSATQLDGDVAVVALWPVPTLVVVGDGLIADALAGAAALLGWSSEVTTDVDTAVRAAGRLHRSDAFVVLSHAREVDGPSLAAALAGPVSAPAFGEEPIEHVTVRTLPPSDGLRLYVIDGSLAHGVDGKVRVLDGARLAIIGQISNGMYGDFDVAEDGRTLLNATTFFPRGDHGERVDVLEYYDPATLLPTAETVLPPKRAEETGVSAFMAQSAGGEYLFIQNASPATSVTVDGWRSARSRDASG